MAARFGVFVGEDHGRLPTMCWLPGLHRQSYVPRFVASSGSCKAAELSILLTSCLAAVGGRVIICCTTVCGGSGGGLFWSVGGSGGVLGGIESGFFGIRFVCMWFLCSLCCIASLSNQGGAGEIGWAGVWQRRLTLFGLWW